MSNNKNDKELLRLFQSVNTGTIEDNPSDFLTVLEDSRYSNVKNCVKENIFKKRYLPMLYNLFKCKTQEDRLIYLSSEEFLEWSKISRSYGEVDIVTDNSTEKDKTILFSVPSIYGYTEPNREAMDSHMNKEWEDNALGQFSLGKLMSYFSISSATNKTLANKFLERQLKQIKHKVIIHDKEESVNKWKAVFDRYATELGIEKKEEVVVKKEEEKKKSPSIDLDELGW